MDEQRLQVYVGLIEQLLGCPQGQEAELLQANAGLVDAELVDVMVLYTKHLESQGNGNALRRVLRLIKQLVEVLRIANSEAEGLPVDSEQFLRTVLQFVAESRGDVQKIYPFLAQYQDHLTESLLQTLPKLAKELLADDAKQQFIATVLFTFGRVIQQFPLGQRWLNLELSITAYQLTLQVYTRKTFPARWARMQNNLAGAYRDRIRGDRANNIEQAIVGYQLTLQVVTCEAFPENWAATQNNLANAYIERIRGDCAENIEQAIAGYQLTLQVYTLEAFPENWATTQNNLAFAYSNRIRGDRANNIEQAIAGYHLTLQVTTHEAFPEDWAGTQTNLANAYRDRIQGNRAENLEQAIAACKLALQVYTREAFPEKWAGTQNALALAYSNRIRGNRAENLEQAISTYQLVLEIYTCEAFPEKWARTQNELANAYSDRIRGDRAENLEQAISTYQLGLQVITHEAFPDDWAGLQSNLAIAYSNRIRGDRAENLEQAIVVYRLVLEVHTREAFPEKWATAQHNRANAFAVRDRGDRAENLEQAIVAYRLVLEVHTREAFPEKWAGLQSNLANAYRDRIRGNRAENLEQAIAAYELALQVRTRNAFPEQWAETQNSLALAYSDRIRGERADNLEQVIAAYELALQVRTRDAFPKECRQTARNLGTLYFEQQNWEAATTTYTTALAAAEILYQSCILLEGKAAELADTADLPRRVAYTLARTGNLDKAVETLEQGRARGLSESLDRDRANLDQLQQRNPKLYTQYRTLTEQLRTLESQQRDRITSEEHHSLTPEALRETAIALRQQLDTLIQEIRQVPDYEKFLALPTFEDVRRAVKSDRPLVYLVPTPVGSLALIVTPEDIQSIWLDALTEEQLREILQTWFDAYNQSQRDRQTWFDTIDQGTRQLWHPLMEPLIRHLKAHNFHQATLIPTGYLSLLPLHAAWTEAPSKPTGRRYTLDDIHFTYAPNAKSLTAAKAIAERVGTDSILAIDEPKHRYLNPLTNEYKPVSALPNSSKEVQQAIATFTASSVFHHEQATRQAVLEALPHRNVWHCSCHGNADLQEPLKSGLAMAGNGEAAILTLRDMLGLKLAEGDRPGLRLAILSACETGMIGTKNADEAISLPTGLLQAGVAAVIASLWSVSDLSTMMLLTRFYDLWRIEGLEISQALRQAQQWVRDTTNSEKIAYFKDFMPDQSAAKMPASTADYLYKSLILSRPDARDFAHPFHWAAFSYVGV